MNLTRWSIVVAALIIAVHPPSILSASVIASASASWTGYSCTWNPTTQTCDAPGTSLGDSTSTTGTNVSADVTPQHAGANGGAQSTALATYGYVSAYARASSGGNLFFGFFISLMQADASASFDDFITIYGGTGVGTVEGLGDFYCCHYYDAIGTADFTLGGATLSAPQSELYSTPFDLLTPFTFGVPFQIRASVHEYARDSAPQDIDQGSADGFASVGLSSLIVRDASGQALTGYTYSTASESRYALQEGTFVPEPNTGTTLLLVLFPGFALSRLISKRPSTSRTSAQ